MSLDQSGREDEATPRQRLLEAAAALFAGKGYSGTSVREIVTAAGVTKPVLYYYFENKEGIFRAILEFAEEKQREILAHVAQARGGFFDRLILLYEEFSEGISEHQNEFKMLYSLFLGPPQGAPEYDLEVYLNRLKEIIQTLYREGVEAGQVIETDPDIVALLFFSLFSLFVRDDSQYGPVYDKEMPLKVIRLAFRGLQKS
ncbi:MAG: TetR/AcrR family transcriptional regulator [Deltaproteobacteria bacterium]|nr:TetR/AcrR family transcriptional regulator [Deltaproteobacteria bacterium]